MIFLIRLLFLNLKIDYCSKSDVRADFRINLGGVRQGLGVVELLMTNVSHFMLFLQLY